MLVSFVPIFPKLEEILVPFVPMFPKLDNFSSYPLSFNKIPDICQEFSISSFTDSTFLQ